MITNLIVVMSVLLNPGIQEGIASQYAKGVMARTVQVRQAGLTAFDLPLELPLVDGYAAVQDCHKIGQLFWMRTRPDRPWQTFLATDCGSFCDRRPDGLSGAAWMREYNILAEVDFRTAQRWGRVGKGIRVQVTWREPRFMTLDKARRLEHVILGEG